MLLSRTVTNIWGDACAVSCVDHWASRKEGAIDDEALMAGPPPGMVDKEHMEHMAMVTSNSPFMLVEIAMHLGDKQASQPLWSNAHMSRILANRICPAETGGMCCRRA